jgi:hypothetical protein
MLKIPMAHLSALLVLGSRPHALTRDFPRPGSNVQSESGWRLLAAVELRA